MGSKALVATNGPAAMQLAFDLGADLKPNGLVIRAGVELSYEDWENIGRAITMVGEAWQWWVADWINHGEKLFGQESSQAADTRETRYDEMHRVTGLDPSTLANIASIGARVARSRRRTPPLKFWMHEPVAPLEPEEQKVWLQRAIEAGWTRNELRQAIREAAGGAPEPEPEADAGDGGHPLLTPGEQLLRAAELVFTQAQREQDGYFRVPGEPMAQLATALGKD